MKLSECGECMEYLLADYAMIREACASVGISRGKSTNDMVIVYMSGYHNSGHSRRFRRGAQETQDPSSL